MNKSSYKIIEALKTEDLEEMVKRSMKNGWVCQGGAFIYSVNGVIRFCQAMV